MKDYEEAPFSNKEKIINVSFNLSDGSSVENIGRNVFNGCTNLTDVSIPDSITDIRSKAFFNCSSLSEMIVPDSVTHIGESAFEGCSNLKKAVLGEGLVSIGQDSVEFNIFKRCVKLIELSMPSLVTSADSKEAKGGQVLKLFNSDCICREDGYFSNSGYVYQLRKITVTSGAEIYPYEFTNLPINEIVLPDTIQKISEYSFYKCDLLKEIRLPEAVTEIGNNAFGNCDLLQKIFLGKNINSIHKSAFSWCSELSCCFYSGSEKQWNELMKPLEQSDISSVCVHFISNNDYVKTIGGDTIDPKKLEPDRGCGDVNSDGITDLTDLTNLSMFLLYDYNFATDAKVYSDITKDGETDIADLAALKMIIMKAR